MISFDNGKHNNLVAAIWYAAIMGATIIVDFFYGRLL